MKKSTITILAIVMGVSFLALLYLQVSYIKEIAKIRNEQFDEGVKRGLIAASKEVELEEAGRWVRKDMQRAAERGDSVTTPLQDLTQRMTMVAPDGTEIEMRAFNDNQLRIPQAISSNHGEKTIQQTSRNMVDNLRKRYIYQRGLLDDVVWQMIYKTSDMPLKERVNFRNLDQYIKTGLTDNGIMLNYHFRIVNAYGREIYRCSDYDSKGTEDTYTQPLFANDPPSKMSVIQVHFPGRQSYIMGSVRFMIPALIFTLVLLITFLFTIYSFFRQKKLSEMRNDFINNMTHEFKTPISTISLAAQMLNDEAVTKSPPMLSHVSTIINDETKRLRMEVEKVLQMSMFDHQRAVLKRKEIDVNELITGVVNTFTLKVGQYGGHIESNLKAENPYIYADEMHITNVVFNLMDNAVKYRRQDVDLQLNVQTWNEGKRVMISIQDNGIGIKKEDVKKIFERFYRVHTGNRHDVKGFGLGLAYVKKIITDHKGSIRAESEPNVGTKFIISLPLLNSKK